MHLSPCHTPWLSRGRGPKRPRGRAPGPGPQGGRGRGEGAEAASTCEHRACSGPGPAAAAPTAPKFAPSRLLSARPACWAVWLWMASAGLAEVPDDRTSGRTQRQTHGPQEPARPLSAHGRPQPPAQRTEPGHVCWSQSRAHEPQRLSRERPPGCGRRPPYPPPQHGHGFGQPPALGLTPTCSEPSFPTAGFTSPRLALRPRPAVTARCSQQLRPRPPRPPQHGPHRDRPNFSPILAETAGVATAQCSLRPAGHSRAPGLGSSFPSRGAEAEARGGGINRLQAAARGRQSRASRHSGRSSAGSS